MGFSLSACLIACITFSSSSVRYTWWRRFLDGSRGLRPAPSLHPPYVDLSGLRLGIDFHLIAVQIIK